MMRQQIDDPAQIHLEGVPGGHTARGGGSGDGDRRLIGRHGVDATGPGGHTAPEWP